MKENYSLGTDDADYTDKGDHVLKRLARLPISSLSAFGGQNVFSLRSPAGKKKISEILEICAKKFNKNEN